MRSSKAFSSVAAVTMLTLVAGTASALPPRWISGNTLSPEKPAPVLLKEFTVDAKPGKAVFTVAVAGWCEVSVNGEKLGEDGSWPRLGDGIDGIVWVRENREDVLL